MKTFNEIIKEADEYIYHKAGDSFSKHHGGKKSGVLVGTVTTKYKRKIGNVLRNKDGKFWCTGNTSFLKSSVLTDTEDEAIQAYIKKNKKNINWNK